MYREVPRRPGSSAGIIEGRRRPHDEHNDTAASGAPEREAKRSRGTDGGALGPGRGARARHTVCNLECMHTMDANWLAVDQTQRFTIQHAAASVGSPDQEGLEWDSRIHESIAQSCSETTEEEWAGVFRNSATDDEGEVDTGEFAFGLAELDAGATSSDKEGEQMATLEMNSAAGSAYSVTPFATPCRSSLCSPPPDSPLCEMVRYCIREEYRQHCRRQSNKDAVKQHLRHVFTLTLTLGQSLTAANSAVPVQVAMRLVQRASAQLEPRFHWLSTIAGCPASPQ